MDNEQSTQLRLQHYEKLRDGYIPNVHTASILKELEKYNTQTKFYTFIPDPKGWTVITTVPIAYYWYGFVQRDEKEAILYIEVAGRIHENAKPIGIDVTLKFSPELGFYNLDETMKGLLGFAPKQQENRGVQEKFMLHKIVSDTQTKTQSEVREMTDKIVSSLTEMGYSRRKAFDAATHAIKSNPKEDNLDALLAQIVEKDYMK